jgi:hypothetical protein
MKGSTKNQLIAVTLIAIVATIILWAQEMRQHYIKLSTLIGISYSPRSKELTYTFSSEVPNAAMIGTTAILKSFKTLPVNNGIVAKLLQGGGVPFKPTHGSSGLTTIVTNTLPEALGANPAFSITGNGVMWFALPTKHSQ